MKCIVKIVLICCALILSGCSYVTDQEYRDLIHNTYDSEFKSWLEKHDYTIQSIQITDQNSIFVEIMPKKYLLENILKKNGVK